MSKNKGSSRGVGPSFKSSQLTMQEVVVPSNTIKLAIWTLRRKQIVVTMVRLTIFIIEPVAYMRALP